MEDKSNAEHGHDNMSREDAAHNGIDANEKSSQSMNNHLNAPRFHLSVKISGEKEFEYVCISVKQPGKPVHYMYEEDDVHKETQTADVHAQVESYDTPITRFKLRQRVWRR